MRWLVLVLLAGMARADDGPAGLYAITARLELPHVERWAVDRTRVMCLDGRLPVPVIAGVGLAGCAAARVRNDGERLGYAIVCPGRDAARAEARYRLGPEGFRGRIAIVMGAKNMTMTEVQTGRRLGACVPAAERRRMGPADCNLARNRSE
jgi:hypothetical protein